MGKASGIARRTAVLASVALACGACSGDAEGVSEGDVVVVDVFSGRENPQFSLSEADAASIDAAITACGDFEANPPARTVALGFRGFQIATEAGLFVIDDEGVWLTDDAGTRLCEGEGPYTAAFTAAAAQVHGLSALLAPY